jgi:hypothetical protein
MTSLPCEFTVNFRFRSPPSRTRTVLASPGTNPRIDANTYFAATARLAQGPLAGQRPQVDAHLSALTPWAVINDKENI